MSSRKKSDPGPRDIQELALVLESLPAIVASFDGDGRLVYLNAAGRDRLQMDERAIETTILSDLLSEPAAERLLRDALPEAARTGRWRGPGELVPRKGDPIPVMQHLISHRLGEGNLAFTLVAHPLDASSEDRETLIAASLGFLHDVNNLLGPIIAYTTLARGEMAPETAAHRYLGQILIAAERARALSESVLQRMRKAAGPSQRVVVADLVHEVVSWLRTEHPGLDVELESPLSTAGLVGDAVGLEQMVLNLCKNAVEALPPEGGKIWIAVREIESPHELRLTVRDNGHGMDEAVLGRIFEPFFSTKAGGTGLGLAIAREAVRRHRGTMTIESSPGSGTSFHVRFPMDG